MGGRVDQEPQPEKENILSGRYQAVKWYAGGGVKVAGSHVPFLRFVLVVPHTYDSADNVFTDTSKGDGDTCR